MVMVYALCTGVMMGLASVALGHPGNGIVVSNEGTVYFADVARKSIWKIEAGGSPSVVVENRWTHSLQITDDGTVYYEREEPAGEVAPSSFWRITPAGEHEMLIAPEYDQSRFGGGDFVVDADQNVYFAQSVRDRAGGWRARILRRTPEGQTHEYTGIGEGPLFTDGGPNDATIRIVTAMALGPDGDIYFADRDHVRRIATKGRDAGTVTTVVAGLIDEHPVDPPDRRGPPTTINRLYGLTVDDGGDVFVAYQAGRRVIHVCPEGTSRVFHRSGKGWSPIGVSAGRGVVHVLEVSDQSIKSLRVLRIEEDGATEIIATLE